MRASIILAILAPVALAQSSSSTATSSSASSTPSISPCIAQCSTIGAQAAGCQSFADLACICTSSKFASTATACLTKNCTSAELTNAKQLQQTECASFTNGTNSIVGSASSAFASASASIHSAVGSALASQSSAALTSASVAATHSSAAMHAVPASAGSFLAIGATILGAVVGPIILFA